MVINGGRNIREPSTAVQVLIFVVAAAVCFVLCAPPRQH